MTTGSPKYRKAVRLVLPRVQRARGETEVSCMAAPNESDWNRVPFNSKGLFYRLSIWEFPKIYIRVTHFRKVPYVLKKHYKVEMKGSSKEVLMELEVGSVNDHP